MCKAIICNGSGEALLKIRALSVWQELELEILGVFTDGNAAWQQIQKNTPDILVAAVEQPGRSGLDLAALAKGCNPDMKVILTADSNDFVSAVRAIQLGVKDYLPAPLDLGALSAALLRSVEELRVLEQNKAIISEGERNARKSQVQCLVFEGLKAFEERYGSAVRQHMQRLTSQICIVSLDNFEAASLTDEVRGEMNRTLFRCLESLGACMTVFEQQQGTATCFLLGDSTAGVTQTRSDCVRKIRETFRRKFPDATITFAFSAIRPNALDLQKSYQEAKLALRERFVRVPGAEIFYDRMKVVEDFPSNDLDGVPAVTGLVSEIRRGDRARVRQEIENLGRQMQKIGGQSYLFMKFYAGNIFFSIRQDLLQYGINLQQLDLNLMREYQQVTELQNMGQVMRHLYSFCMKIMDALEQNSSKGGVKAIAAARTYIDEHYADHDLTMDDVASHVHMSPSYFSVMFKQETGLAFTNYLIALRIRKSKELIRNSNLKIYEIATRSGYDTAAYYSTAFKKETGMSPSEYKKKYLATRAQGEILPEDD